MIGQRVSCYVNDDPCNGPLKPNTEYRIWYQLHSGDAVADYDFNVFIKTGIIIIKFHELWDPLNTYFHHGNDEDKVGIDIVVYGIVNLGHH